MADENGARGLLNPDLTDRLKDVTQETKHLVQQEMELAKAEILQKMDLLKDEFERAGSQINYELQATKGELVEIGKKAGIGAGLFSGAGLFGLAAFATLTVALVAGLAEFLPVWVSALAVTVIYGGVAGGLAMAGKGKIEEAQAEVPDATQHIDRMKGVVTGAKDRMQDVPLAPQQTIDSIKQSKDDLQSAWQRGQNR
ncbi:MAG TPA: phage holin family protein [Actinomycetota bacterium]|nr:phage holin family protein [Actinomycetota bacterium]